MEKHLTTPPNNSVNRSAAIRFLNVASMSCATPGYAGVRPLQWPRICDPGFRDYPADSWLGRVVRVLLGYKEKSAEFMSHGDYDVWPFLNRSEFEEARKKPVLLSGKI
jgi:hypothetical protein